MRATEDTPAGQPRIELEPADDKSISPFPFIVGRGRSGTTLLRAMFDSHPDMAVPPESHALVRLGRNRQKYERVEGFDVDVFVQDARRVWTRKWGLPGDELPEALASTALTTTPDAVRALFSAYADRHGKHRYAEKTPVNVMHIAFLAELFPESRFIHIIRDGRDVTLSYLSVDFGVESIGEGAIYWRRAVEQGREDGSRLGPARYREVKYEDLVQGPEATLRDLCDFAGLPFDPSMLRYFERVHAVKAQIHSTAHLRLSQPPEKAREWRDEMEPRDLALFEALAGPTLERFGYPRGLHVVPTTARLRAVVATAGVNAHRLGRACAKRARKFMKKKSRRRANG